MRVADQERDFIYERSEINNQASGFNQSLSFKHWKCIFKNN